MSTAGAATAAAQVIAFASAALGDVATLVSDPVTIPVHGIGSIAIRVNLLGYTMGTAAPTIDSLLEQVRAQVRGALASKAVPEAQLDATTTTVLAGVVAVGIS